MVILGLVFVPIMCVNALNEIAALTLLRGADFLSVLGQPQREAMAMLFLDLHRYGYVIGWIFGPWLFFFGLLVFKSGFLPRILGVLLITACFGYVDLTNASRVAPEDRGLVAYDGRSEVVMPTFGCHDPAGTRIGTRKLLARR